MKNNTVRWGIIGTGRIANAFAAGLRHTTNGELCAVGSRDIKNASAFAQECEISLAFGSYEELAKSDEVDGFILQLLIRLMLRTQFFVCRTVKPCM